ncbi:amino acid adenylation domain-containing protein [Kitasatospora sp. MAA4]|uniref:amino acid adenylation domain-containing protein n=1 Tax=Kitasatospora sp. MAA4 TaxID=3035093 RepID=UPI0024761136|nr:amino acid adenylation domain-containing protein [Kitasatospora sp. MAA4]MDH6131460.1 amino acid adenylation domain-containing protein [Kitasatospora sp. MAA4]
MQSELCLHQIFAAQAALRPDAPALSDPDEELTYRQLDERADRLAAAILSRVPGPGARVGLHLRRGNAVVVAILAVLKAGCSYVPLDPSYPADRVRFMAEDASVDLVLTDTDHGTGSAPAVGELLPLDAALWAPHAPRVGEVTVTPDAPAYVIYTSGSSGTPKGVEVSHRNVTALLAACDRVLELDHEDVWTLFHSYCFDFSVWELWGALAHGAKLVVVPAEVARLPESTLELLRAERVTVLNQVPSVFRYLSRAGTDVLDDDESPEPLALRYVIFGGEVVDVDAVREWRQFHGTATGFVNMYGITETTVFSTYRHLLAAEMDAPVGSPVRPGDPDPALNIGLPLEGFELALLAEDGSPTPLGEIGEIHLAGPQLAIGYLDRPELTAERYPLLAPAGGTPRRYYRSGDLGVARADGSIEYAGRADDQVKVNGYRIEIGEVESALRSAPGVADLVVVPTTSRIGERQLVAFYTVPDGIAADGVAEPLAAHARAALPVFMVPGRFVHVPALPLSPSGKTDKRALAAQL